MKITHFACCATCRQEYYDHPADRMSCPSCGAGITPVAQEWDDDDATSIAELLRRAGYRSPFEPVIVDMGHDWGVCSVAQADLFGLQRGGDVMVRTWRRPAFGRVLPAGSTILPTNSNRSLVRGGRPVCADAAKIALDSIRGEKT